MKVRMATELTWSVPGLATSALRLKELENASGASDFLYSYDIINTCWASYTETKSSRCAVMQIRCGKPHAKLLILYRCLDRIVNPY
jgi:hypothetical protein